MFETINESNSSPTGKGNMDETRFELQSVNLPQNEDESQSFEDNKQSLSKKMLKEKSKCIKNELEEIHKETQRIVRESCISIPYHKPKQRSLTEFLQRRQSIPSVPLRTSVEKLNQVWKHLEERERNVEKFYKSDSENEDDITEKEINSSSSVIDNQACSEVKKCTDVSDKNEKNNYMALASQTECKGEIGDTSRVCMESTSQSERECRLIECSFHKNKKECLEYNGVSNETLDSKEKPDGVSNYSTVNINMSSKCTVRDEMKPNGETTYCENTSDNNKYSEDDTIIAKESVKIPKFLQVEHGIIDLSSSGMSGVSDLMQRFIKHTNLKTRLDEKSPVSISVTSTEYDGSGHVTSIKEDIINILQPNNISDKEENPKLHRPGAKLTKLKAELQAHMVLRRGQEWSKRQVKKLYEDEFIEEEKSKFDCKSNEDDDYDNSVSEDESSDQGEEEENMYVLSKTCKKRSHTKNVFLDDEAEVSEAETQENSEDEDDDEGMIPPYQLMSDDREEAYSVCEEERSTLLSQSPALCLTALEGKDLQRNVSFEESPVKQIVFTPLKNTKTSVPGLCGLIDSPLQTQGAQDLMGLCSGQFQTQPIRCSLLEAYDEYRTNSQDISLTWPEDSQPEEDSQKTVAPTTQTSFQTSEWKNILTELSPDEENSQDLKTTKKRHRKLSFSDDEDEAAEENKGGESDCNVEAEIENEESNKISEEHIESDSEFDDNQSEDSNREVEYDSEENEAQFDGGKFLDVEAELSESEWDSGDEDEANLDDMEKEEADKENIDEDAVKEELEKLHMKRMLVEDKKEVRLLQEMLLEDGDLHSDGGGRKRIFRWANNGPMDNNQDQNFGEEGPDKLDRESDEDKDVEEEDELSWRRFRHEREMYLREHKKKIELLGAEDDDDEEEESQIIKLGRAALKKMNNHSNSLKSTLSTDKSPGARCSLFQMHSRGSFLARGQEVLTRLAHITAVSETNNAQLLQPKYSHNFVFSTVSPQKETDSEPAGPKVTKRKFEAEPILLPAPKRPCVPKVIKPTNGRKSLLEQLAKCES